MPEFLSSPSVRPALLVAVTLAGLALLSLGGAFAGSRAAWNPTPQEHPRQVPPIDLNRPQRVETATFAFG